MILFKTHLFPEKRRQFTNTGECRALRAFLADQYAPLGDRWTITGYFQVGSWDIQKKYKKDHGSSKFGSRFSQRHELTTAYNQYKQREVWAGHLPTKTKQQWLSPMNSWLIFASFFLPLFWMLWERPCSCLLCQCNTQISHTGSASGWHRQNSRVTNLTRNQWNESVNGCEIARSG